MNDLMIDIETLSIKDTAAVISIGACFFDTKTKEIGAKFSMNLKLDEQLKNRTVDADTLKWWFTQSDAAKRVFSEEALPTDIVLKTFAAWVLANARVEEVRPWGNGATFDISILENLFRQYNIDPPWVFWNVRDLRTFREYVAGNAKVTKLGIDHNALDDAMSQAKYVMEHVK